MKVVLTGIQGSGKSTQGNLLEKQLHIPYLSTGHIFRRIAKEKTTLGRYIKTVMNAGILIPDDKTIEIVNSYLSRPEYKRGYILDGFPRTLEQAKRFKNNVDKVVYIDIPDKEALWRLAYRNDADRDDNTIQALRKRIESFHKYTEPVLEYYKKKKKLVEIDGTQSIEEVNDEILKSLGKQLVKNQVENWKQNEKAIIAMVGLPGVGKTDAANYYREKGLPIISFGKIVTELVEKKFGKQTEEYHKIVREGVRAEHGIDALAKLSEKKIHEALKKHNIVVIDGMRSWEEYLYLKEALKGVRVYILALYADKSVRYHRVSARKSDRPELYGAERDMNELVRINMGTTIAFADFLIKNNFSKNEFHDKLEEVYREVYFS
jgi:adenylate kinase